MERKTKVVIVGENHSSILESMIKGKQGQILLTLGNARYLEMFDVKVDKNRIKKGIVEYMDVFLSFVGLSLRALEWETGVLEKHKDAVFLTELSKREFKQQQAEKEEYIKKYRKNAIIPKFSSLDFVDGRVLENIEKLQIDFFRKYIGYCEKWDFDDYFEYKIPRDIEDRLKGPNWLTVKIREIPATIRLLKLIRKYKKTHNEILIVTGGKHLRVYSTLLKISGLIARLTIEPLRTPPDIENRLQEGLDKMTKIKKGLDSYLENLAKKHDVRLMKGGAYAAKSVKL